MPALLSLLIAVLILALLVWFAMWLIDMIPLPDVPKVILKCVVGIIALIYVLGWLVGWSPRPIL